eukprot:ctg_178.g131
MSWRERAPVVHLRAETQSVKDLIEDLTGLKDLRRFAEDEHTAILLDVCPGEDSGLAGAVMMTEERERSLSPSTRDSNGGEASLSYRCWTGTGTAPREVCVASVVRGLVEEWRERGVLASNAMVAEAMQSLLFEGNSREDGEAAGNGETNGHASVSTSSSSAGKHSMPPSGGAYPRECLTGPGFVVCMGRVRGLARRCVAMARLAQPSAVSLFGAEDVSFVCVVLKPEGRELRAWKELLESANTLAAVFRDRTFFWIAMQVATEEEFRHELALFAERRRQLADVLFEMRTMGRSPPADTEVEDVLAMTATRGRGQMRHRRRRQRDSSDDSDEEAETAASPATSPTRRRGPVPAWLPGLEPPGGLGRGIVEDVKRRWKWYRSDFTDGMTDRRSLLGRLWHGRPVQHRSRFRRHGGTGHAGGRRLRVRAVRRPAAGHHQSDRPADGVQPGDSQLGQGAQHPLSALLRLDRHLDLHLGDNPSGDQPQHIHEMGGQVHRGDLRAAEHRAVSAVDVSLHRHLPDGFWAAADPTHVLSAAVAARTGQRLWCAGGRHQLGGAAVRVRQCERAAFGAAAGEHSRLLSDHVGAVVVCAAGRSAGAPRLLGNEQAEEGRRLPSGPAVAGAADAVLLAARPAVRQRHAAALAHACARAGRYRGVPHARTRVRAGAAGTRNARYRAGDPRADIPADPVCPRPAELCGHRGGVRLLSLPGHHVGGGQSAVGAHAILLYAGGATAAAPLHPARAYAPRAPVHRDTGRAAGGAVVCVAELLPG